MVQGFERERAAIRSGDLREARRLLVVAATRPLTREQRATQRVTLAEVLLLTAEREEAVRLATLALRTDHLLQALRNLPLAPSLPPDRINAISTALSRMTAANLELRLSLGQLSATGFRHWPR